MIKKTLSLLLAFILLLLPVAASASDYADGLDIYINNDEQLKSLYSTYQAFIEEYDERVYDIMNQSTGSSLSYYQAYSYINKLTGKIQLDRILEQNIESILNAKMNLLMSYRNQYYTMYSLEKTMNDSYEYYLNQLETYEANLLLYKQGYINKNALDLSEYYKKSAYVSYMSSKRSYENKLRDYNLSLGKDHDVTGYIFTIEEEMTPLSEKEVYLESIQENSSLLKQYNVNIEIGNIKADWLEAYNLDITSYDAHLDYRKTKINIQLSELQKQKYLEETTAEVERIYSTLLFDKRTIENYLLSIEINKRLVEENKGFYLKGYIEKEEYDSYVEKYESSIIGYREKVYSYNSMIIYLEYLSCLYMKGEF